jgi:acetoacetate decarboxylase
VDETITTPAGFTITPASDGSYRVCDLQRHCLTTTSLWEAQQLVRVAEVRHRGLVDDGNPQATS